MLTKEIGVVAAASPRARCSVAAAPPGCRRLVTAALPRRRGDVTASTLQRLEAQTIQSIFKAGLHEFVSDFIRDNSALAFKIEEDYRFYG